MTDLVKSVFKAPVPAYCFANVSALSAHTEIAKIGWHSMSLEKIFMTPRARKTKPAPHETSEWVKVYIYCSRLSSDVTTIALIEQTRYIENSACIVLIVLDNYFTTCIELNFEMIPENCFAENLLIKIILQTITNVKCLT